MKKSSINYQYLDFAKSNTNSTAGFFKRNKLKLLLTCTFLASLLVIYYFARPNSNNNDQAVKIIEPVQIDQLELTSDVDKDIDIDRDVDITVSDLTLPIIDSTNDLIIEQTPSYQDKIDVITSEITTEAEHNSDTIELSDFQTITVRNGDNLSNLFARMSLSPRALYEVVNTNELTKRLSRIYPNQTLHYQLTTDGELSQLILEISPKEQLHIQREDDGFSANIFNHPIDITTKYVEGTINQSLYVSAAQAGLPASLIIELADIFAWDVDFVFDIREGDKFRVLFEQHLIDGEPIEYGPILAAEFINQGRVLQAVRYQDTNERVSYYTPEGLNMRKAFLRTPVNFTRISSRFNLNRRHPVLNTIRAHRGVDYAAPTGTPVKAAGDGRIVDIGRNGGYGKIIKIQHGQKYATLYAHLNGYARGLKKGDSVKQGQTIGYVGQTGLATGPHLHYEFLVNGVHRDPLKVDLPTADPIADNERTEFLLTADNLLNQLNEQTTIQTADISP